MTWLTKLIHRLTDRLRAYNQQFIETGLGSFNEETCFGAEWCDCGCEGKSSPGIPEEWGEFLK